MVWQIKMPNTQVRSWHRQKMLDAVACINDQSPHGVVGGGDSFWRLTGQLSGVYNTAAEMNNHGGFRVLGISLVKTLEMHLV